MKKLILAMSIGSLSFAHLAQAAFTSCKLDYKITSYAFLAEYGTGKAKVTCKDALGHEYEKDLKVRMGGLGAKAGICKARGHVEAIGLGFSFNEFVSAMGKVEVGMILGNKVGGTIDLGSAINPTLDLRVSAGGTKYSGKCVGIGSIQGLFFNERVSDGTQEPEPQEPLESQEPQELEGNS